MSGDSLAVPGASRTAFCAGDVDEFLAGLGPRSAAGAGPMPQDFAQFEAIYQNGRPDRPLGAPQPGLGLPGLAPFLHVRIFLDKDRITTSELACFSVNCSGLLLATMCISSSDDRGCCAGIPGECQGAGYLSAAAVPATAIDTAGSVPDP